MFGRFLVRQARSFTTYNARRTRFVGLTGAFTAFTAGFAALNLTSFTQLDSPKAHGVLDDHSVSIDGAIDPIPLNYYKSKQSNLSSDFQLLGYGVRTVTFLSVKVYGIGLYLANEDIAKVKPLVAQQDLMDPDNSTSVIGDLLDDNVRYAARICPIRNTDFTHLKDGLIKSILANRISKAPETREEVSEGLNQMRELFNGFRGSVPKNHALWIERLANGGLSFAYENTETGEIKPMGVIENILVGKVLFLQYMTGKKPLSEKLRQSVVEGYKNL